MSALLQDLRYAIRQLRRTPGITLLVILTVSLGIGANTAVFSVVNGFLRPLPVKSPEQIVVLAAEAQGDETGFEYRFSYPALEDFRRQADRFSDIFAFNAMLGGLGVDGRTAQILYSAVTGNFFSALGVKPAAGRLFFPGEGEKPGTESVVVLGYSYWQKRFGGNPAVVGKQVRLDGKAARIVGIAPKGFYGLYAGADMDGYLPLNSLMARFAEGDRFLTNRHSRPLTVFARLKPGVSIPQAQGAMDVLLRRLGNEFPASDRGITVRVTPETLARPMPMRVLSRAVPVLRIFLLVLAGLVLMLACLNVANILMVRATIRQREMAIRAALGSGRGRLLRQTLTESILLAALGGAAGLVLGKWGSDAFAASMDLATDFPIVLDFSFDWRVFTYALIAAVSTGIFVGIWPAVRGSRVEANTVLHDGARDSGGAGRGRARGVLVVAQVAGSLVLLIVAGLFARSLQHAQQMDLGFDSAHLLNVRLAPGEVGYSEARTNDFFRELERRVRALPGVQSTAVAFSVPMGYIFDGQPVFPEGRPEAPGEQPPIAGCNYVGPGYFETMRIPLLRGRGFTESDDQASRLVAVVNQTMAARFWPGEDPVGKRFRTSHGGPLAEVVGVAHDSKYVVVFERAEPYFYFPMAQTSVMLRTLQVRTSVGPESLAPLVQREIQSLDPDVPIADLRTMKDSLAGVFGFFMFRTGAIQGAAMAILGLALAAIGVYGVVSYSATQRTREIGIRMALGAEPADVRQLVLGHGLRLVFTGVAAGLVFAAVFTRVVAGYVLLVSAMDPLTFVIVTLLLATIALWACYLPARRAMRVDPMVALRHE